MHYDRFISIFIIIIIGILGGIIVTFISNLWPLGNPAHDLLQSLGIGLLTTAFIGIILDLLWSKERTKVEKAELNPLIEQLGEATNKLTKLEGRLEAFRELGFNYCHSKRNKALKSFYEYAKELISSPIMTDEPFGKTINIVSSSARGLMGYLDRDPEEVQRQWRTLITTKPNYFRILLTHPAYAHLRQPAEERSSGDIELEILKTAIYLHCVAGMRSLQLRFYRGSPTVFAIQAGKHILLNPYPYGQMAMDTLCLEFESDDEQSYVSKFMSMHFNHTWAFIRSPSKLVDQKPLVVGIENFEDILQAFSECTFLKNSKHLRLTKSQVIELDSFTCITLPELNEKFVVPTPCPEPFMNLIKDRNLQCSWIFR